MARRGFRLGGLTLKQYDPEYLEEMSGGDQEFVRDIISTFLENAQNLVDALAAAGAEGNAEKAIYAAHTLKGSARSVGAGPLGDLCEELEKLARTNDMQGYSQLVNQIPESFSLLKIEFVPVLQAQAA